jgi:hypothetical protein
MSYAELEERVVKAEELLGRALCAIKMLSNYDQTGLSD